MMGESVSDIGRTNRPSELTVATRSSVDRTGWVTTDRVTGTTWPSPVRTASTARPAS